METIFEALATPILSIWNGINPFSDWCHIPTAPWYFCRLIIDVNDLNIGPLITSLSWFWIEYYASLCTHVRTYMLLLISMLWRRQATFESKWDKLSSSAECRIRTQGLRHQITSRLNARWQSGSSYKKPELNRPSRAMISEHSTPLPVGFRTWLWRCTCLLLLISGKRLSNRKEISCLPLLNAGRISSRPNARWQTECVIPMAGPGRHWTTGNPFGMNRCMCVNFELRPSSANIHICCVDFWCSGTGNRTKPTNEPTYGGEPCGNWTHDVQTEATSPAASCPVR